MAVVGFHPGFGVLGMCPSAARIRRRLNGRGFINDEAVGRFARHKVAQGLHKPGFAALLPITEHEVFVEGEASVAGGRPIFPYPAAVGHIGAGGQEPLAFRPGFYQAVVFASNILSQDAHCHAAPVQYPGHIQAFRACLRRCGHLGGINGIYFPALQFGA